MKSGEKQHREMTERPVGRLIVSLAGPTVASMLVSALYNMADTFFVAKLGTSATGAVGIVFSLMAIIQAIGFTIGMGTGSNISRFLGAREQAKACQYSSSALFLGLVLGSVLAVLGLIFVDPMMRLLGATPTILPHARAYAGYILFAAPVMCGAFILNNILRGEGKARLAMVGLMTGGLLNCVLDPLFIFTFKLGIAGAAIATAISQCVSFTILLSAFLRGRTSCSLSWRRITGKIGVYLHILHTGLPSLFRQGLASIAAVTLNVSAAVYGDAAVAGMTIVTKIFLFVFVVIIGIGQGYQPVVGYNYGARLFGRVREAFFFTLKLTGVVMLVGAALLYVFAPHLVALFISKDRAVVEIGVTALRAQALAMPLIPLGVMCNMTFQTVGRSWTATLLSTMRQGVFFLPLVLVLPRFIGFLGVQIAQPLSDCCTFVACLPFIIAFFRSLKNGSAKISNK